MAPLARREFDKARGRLLSSHPVGENPIRQILILGHLESCGPRAVARRRRRRRRRGWVGPRGRRAFPNQAPDVPVDLVWLRGKSGRRREIEDCGMR
eukprot:188627-Pyramimonas_sp.AAC.1